MSEGSGRACKMKWNRVPRMLKRAKSRGSPPSQYIWRYRLNGQDTSPSSWQSGFEPRYRHHSRKAGKIAITLPLSGRTLARYHTYTTDGQGFGVWNKTVGCEWSSLYIISLPINFAPGTWTRVRVILRLVRLILGSYRHMRRIYIIPFCEIMISWCNPRLNINHLTK